MILTKEFTVKWNNMNREYCTSKGYEYTGYRKSFIVRIEDAHPNSTVKVDATCDYCGKEFKRTISDLNRPQQGKHTCRACFPLKSKDTFIEKYGVSHHMKIESQKEYFASMQRKDINVIENEFNDRGYVLTGGTYKNMKSRLEFICQKHIDKGKQSIKYSSFCTGSGCKYCSREKMIESKRLSDEEIFSKFSTREDIEVIETYFVDKDLKNNHYQRRVKYRCKKNKEHYNIIQDTSYSILSEGFSCPICKFDSKRGENSNFWDGGVSSENDLIRHSIEYRQWQRAVLKRDSYTCQCCGTKSRNMQTHHIESFSENKELRFDVDNGISLCVDCHDSRIPGSFHNIYGTKHNTREQFEEYMLLCRQ